MEISSKREHINGDLIVLLRAFTQTERMPRMCAERGNNCIRKPLICENFEVFAIIVIKVMRYKVQNTPLSGFKSPDVLFVDI